MNRRWILPVVVLLMLTGCLARTQRREIVFGGQRAIELSNTQVRAVIVPATGRVMWFSRVGGENLLWVNPSEDGTPKRYGGWANHGGEKAWIWPQDDWEKIAGSGWPPKMDGKLFREVTSYPPDSVWLWSNEIPGFGVTMTRKFFLAPESSRLVVFTELVPRENATSARIAPWSVVQIPRPMMLEVPGKESPVQRVFSGRALPILVGSPGTTALSPHFVEAGTKVGMHVKQIAAVGDTDVLTVRIEDASDGEYRPGEQAQIYLHEQHVEGQPSHEYIEIEFTGPLAPATQEQRLTISLEAQAKP
jgi:hypothetical protein